MVTLASSLDQKSIQVVSDNCRKSLDSTSFLLDHIRIFGCNDILYGCHLLLRFYRRQLCLEQNQIWILSCWGSQSWLWAALSPPSDFTSNPSFTLLRQLETWPSILSHHLHWLCRWPPANGSNSSSWRRSRWCALQRNAWLLKDSSSHWQMS